MSIMIIKMILMLVNMKTIVNYRESEHLNGASSEINEQGGI